jgi:threonine synthase
VVIFYNITRSPVESGGIAMAVNDEGRLNMQCCEQQTIGLLCPEGGATLAACMTPLQVVWLQQPIELILFSCSAGLHPMPEAPQ